MTLLLDSHALLWWLDDSSRLGDDARNALATTENEARFSMASIWDLAIKISLGKLVLSRDLPEAVELLHRNAVHPVPIEAHHCVAVSRLPFYHRDPFDRLLAVQAQCDGYCILSRDAAFDRYSIDRIW